MQKANVLHEENMTKATNARWIYISLPLMLLFTVSMIDKSNINILFAERQFLQDLAISDNVIKGTLSSVFLITYALGQFFWGFVVDRIGAFKSGMIGIAIWGIAMIIGGVATSVTALLWSRALLGVGEGVLYPIALTLTAKWFPQQEQGKAQSFWFTGNAIGPVIGIPAIALIAASFGWRESYFALAIISFICLAIFIFMIRNKPSEHYATNAAEVNYIEKGQGVKKTANIDTGSVKSVLTSPLFWILTTVYACVSIGFFGFSTFLPSYLTEAKGIDFVNSAMINAAGYALAIIVQLVCGYLSDRWMKRAIFVAVASVIIIGCFVGFLYTTNTTIVILLTIILLSVLYMPAPITMTMLHEVASSQVMGRISGTFGCVSYLVAAAGPMVVGFFSTTTGSFTGGFMALISFIVLSLLLCVYLMKKGY
ncbi:MULTISPECIES: MFS transporter [Cytobacillus]|uniref:MFS transporter n=1 Tax=Cytobacillus TaxID=2675230 RepID=UPI00203A5491|nr:MFS transporter [Cytobacillus kochii]MCM3321151.1 MFS transporter [Cytobacillus kochii]MCM3344016.1 MFS transporter [Cytobacillus kochii]